MCNILFGVHNKNIQLNRTLSLVIIMEFNDYIKLIGSNKVGQNDHCLAKAYTNMIG